MSTLVLREDAGSVATLTLKRPGRLNALSVDVYRALLTHLDDIAESHESIKAVVLRVPIDAFQPVTTWRICCRAKDNSGFVQRGYKRLLADTDMRSIGRRAWVPTCSSALAGGGIFNRTLAGKITHWLTQRRWIGRLSFNHDGGFVCSGLGGLVICKATGEQSPLITSIEGVAIVAVNDIYADDAGSMYGRTVDFLAIERKKAPLSGVFFRLDPPDRITVVCREVNVSNGIRLSPDRPLLYHSETSVGVWVAALDRGRSPVAGQVNPVARF